MKPKMQNRFRRIGALFLSLVMVLGVSGTVSAADLGALGNTTDKRVAMGDTFTLPAGSAVTSVTLTALGGATAATTDAAAFQQNLTVTVPDLAAAKAAVSTSWTWTNEKVAGWNLTITGAGTADTKIALKAVQGYAVNIGTTTSCNIALTTPGQTLAAAGDTVSFTVTAASGYAVSPETVLANSTIPTPITRPDPTNTPNLYSFTMPAADVTLTASAVLQTATAPVFPNGTSGAETVDEQSLAASTYSVTSPDSIPGHTLSYKWYRAGVDGQPGEFIAGQESNTLAYSSLGSLTPGAHTFLLVATATRDDNGQTATATFTLTLNVYRKIDPAAVIIGDQAYTGSPIVPSVTIQGANGPLTQGTDSANGDFYVTAVNNTAAADKTHPTAAPNATVTFNSPYYTFNTDSKSADFVFTILPADMAYTAPDQTAYYDGKPHSLAVKVTTPADPAAYTIQYSTTGLDGSYSTNNPTFTDRGTYTVYYKIEAENYNTVTGSATLRIQSRPSSSDTTYYSIQARQTEGGYISPSGSSVSEHSNHTVNIRPYDGYKVDDVYVDGKSVGAVESYTFKNVTRDHKIYADFVKISRPEQEVSKLEVPYYINDDGDEQPIRFSAYIKDSWKYILPKDAHRVKYKTVEMNFRDIEDHDDLDSIEFVVARELFYGVTNREFGPETGMSRGMFVTVMARLFDADLSKYTVSPYLDVNINEYYGPAAAWAKDVGLMFGVGEGYFAPYKEIDREELACLMHRAASWSKYLDTTPRADLSKYSDRSQISGWALDSMRYATAMDLLVQDSNRYLNPKDIASRAELAVTLENFITEAVR